jgi:hypothetical protein
MLQSSIGRDSALESIAAKRAVFSKCSVDNLVLKLPLINPIAKNVVYVDPTTGELSQFGGSLPTTGSYTPQVLFADPALFDTVTVQTALFTKLNDVVTVYGTLLANYSGGSNVGDLTLTVPPELPFDDNVYSVSTVGSAMFTGGINPGLYLQKHRMESELTIVFELATMTQNIVSPQPDLNFTYSFTYLTTAV